MNSAHHCNPASGIVCPELAEHFSLNPSANTEPAVLVGAVVLYFAYMGFEYQPALSEETVNPERVMPKSIVQAVGVTTLIHLLVSVSIETYQRARSLSLAGRPLLIQR